MNTINYLGNSSKTGIYLIKNLINNKIYVGSTKVAFHNRKTRHLTSLRANYHYNEYLQNSWNKYGEENFIFEIKILCAPEECEKWEAYLIELYKSNERDYGYNIASVREYRFNYKLGEQQSKNMSSLKEQKALLKSGLVYSEKGLNKAILLFDINGNFIKKYDSGKELSKDKKWTRAAISKTLSNRKLFLNNHIIIFENDSLTKEDVEFVKNNFLPKRVYLCTLDDIEIKEFNSAKEAAVFLNCKDAEIRMCCTGKRKRIGKYKTKYNGTKS